MGARWRAEPPVGEGYELLRSYDQHERSECVSNDDCRAATVLTRQNENGTMTDKAKTISCKTP